jgi:hypothetical protein
MQKLINYQIQHVSEQELYQYATEYNISLSSNEAKSIVSILRNNTIDIFDKQKRLSILKKISRDVNPTVAKKLNVIIEQLIN